jgi:hypothetical protein
MPLLLTLLMHAVLPQEQHYDLRDQECGSQQILIGELDGLAIWGRCHTANGNRVMDITVRIESRTDAGPLQAFTVGFCADPVITAVAPDEWDVEVRGGSRTSVAWRFKSPTGVPKPTASGTVTLTGFSLVLRPGWMRSRYMDVGWADNAAGIASGSGTSTTHDCPQ